jgi:hypothetical protein
MCLRFIFLLITRVAAWLRLSRRPKLNWADRALIATLLGLIPKARRQGLGLLVTRTRSCAGTATSSAAAGPPGPCAAGLADRRLGGTSRPWSDG